MRTPLLRAGGLPGDLLALANESVSIGGNAFASVQLPPVWASATLAVLNLSRNNFAGLLPVPWGNRMPALRRLDLTGCRLRGPIPQDWWLGGFAEGAVVDLRTSSASNEEVCGGRRSVATRSL